MYGIMSGYLENGMQVILHKTHNNRTIACGVWVNQGSKHEDDKTNGLSHLVEHLLINRNSDSNFNYLMNEVINNGIRYNASTTKEYTSFFLKGLSNNLNLYLDVLYNIVAKRKKFKKQLVENEKKVVEREAISYYSSFNQIKERTSQALYGNLDIGRIIVGDLKVIRNASVNQIEELIKKTYVPEYSTLVMVGDINYEDVLNKISDKFSGWEGRNKLNYKEVIEREPGIYFNELAQSQNAVVSIGFRLPMMDDDSVISTEIGATILGDTLVGARIPHEIRDKKGLAYNVGAFVNSYKNKGTLGFTAVCKHESVKEVVTIMMNEFNKVKLHGFNKEELKKAKKAIETRRLLNLDNLSNQLNHLGNNVVRGKLYSLEHEMRCIKNIELDLVNNSMNNIFQEDNIGLALIGNCDIDDIIPKLTF